MRKRALILLSLFFLSSLNAETVSTCYGDFEVEEPVLLELIHSPAMQRLKGIHQYGVVPHMLPCEDYSRYEHSLGVWALLRAQERPLQEQIAGLLHDVSHTAFSHFADYFFDYFNEYESYQDSIHAWYLEASGIETILEAHGFTLEQAMPKTGRYPAVYQALPDLCADRGDYNIQGAYLRGQLTKEEMLYLFNDLRFEDGKWTLSDISLAEKLGEFSLYMSLYVWNGPHQSHANTLLGFAVGEVIDEGDLEIEALLFGVDKEIWDVLEGSSNPVVQDSLQQITSIYDSIEVCQARDATHAYPVKCRGIDPLIRLDNGELKRLSQISPDYAELFQSVKERCKSGWYVRPMRLQAQEA
jgi:HD superfamily phosphohydrolase